MSCNKAASGCAVAFKFTLPSSTALPATVKFNGSESHGSTSSDNILERSWSWGDGSTLGGNQGIKAVSYIPNIKT